MLIGVRLHKPYCREKNQVTKARLDGVYLLLLGSVVFLLLGVALESIVPDSMTDFKGLITRRAA